MFRSARRFAELLQEGITAIANRTSKPKGVIRDELGYAVGREGGSAIEYWGYGDGHIPSKNAEVAGLARALVQTGKLDRKWLGSFLESAEYAQPAELVAELFPEQAGNLSHNLPLEMTPLIGRQEELCLLRQRLRDPRCRLLTIVGAGGMGKSRLALAVAHSALGAFPDGIYRLPLLEVDNSANLAAALVNALGGETAESGDRQQRLIQLLGCKRLLLLLDDFEHLVDHVGFLADLLQAAPHVKLLVTSRRRLALQEEWLFPLSGLPYPSGSGSEFSELDTKSYPAVELFAQCARTIRPGFSFAQEWEGVAAICRLVAGMPLGIELAADWVRLMSCAEIATELARNLDFLHSVRYNLPHEHRSLRAVFERSWRLLSDEEQRVLRQLSVFRGGFEKEAAIAVIDASPLALSKLVDWSLIHWEQAQHRLYLHELLRQFVAEKLAAEPREEAQVRRNHFRYYNTQFSRVQSLLKRAAHKPEPKRNQPFPRPLSVDADNLQVAALWAAEHRDEIVAGHTLRALKNYCSGADRGQVERQIVKCSPLPTG